MRKDYHQRRYQDCSTLSSMRIHYLRPELLMSYATAVSLSHHLNPMEDDLGRSQSTTDGKALTLVDSLRKAIPPKSLKTMNMDRPRLMLEEGAIVPIQVALLISSALSRQDSAYRPTTTHLRQFFKNR